MKKTKELGVIIIVISVLTIPVVLSIFAISKFVMQQKLQETMTSSYSVETTSPSPRPESSNDFGLSLTESGETATLGEPMRGETAFRILNVVLGLLPLLAIFIGLPLGVILLVSGKSQTTPPGQTMPMQK